MSIGIIVLLGVLLVGLIIGLFTLLTNPLEVDEEEAHKVEKEKKRRWWSR